MEGEYNYELFIKEKFNLNVNRRNSFDKESLDFNMSCIDSLQSSNNNPINHCDSNASINNIDMNSNDTVKNENMKLKENLMNFEVFPENVQITINKIKEELNINQINENQLYEYQNLCIALNRGKGKYRSRIFKNFTCDSILINKYNKSHFGRPKKSNQNKFHKPRVNNLFEKIKGIIKKSIIDYINKYFEVNLLKLPYKGFAKCNTNIDEILLNTQIKKIVSVNISKKYSTITPTHNKDIIEMLYKKSPEDATKILELTLEEYIDIFLYKRKDDFCERIKMSKIDELIFEIYKEMKKKNSSKYYIYDQILTITTLFYNLKLYIHNKTRKRPKNSKE